MTSGRVGGLDVWTAQRGLKYWTTSRWLFLKHIQLVKTLIFLFLVSYIRTNGRLIMANSRNVISSGPEMLAGKIPATPHISAVWRSTGGHGRIADDLPALHILCDSRGLRTLIPNTIDFFLYFGIHTIWYLHSHNAWLKLRLSFNWNLLPQKLWAVHG